MDILDLVRAAFLGVLQGLTEFLPISSTAHLLLGADMIGYDDPGGVFTVMIQLGSILAVMWLYRERIFKVVTGLPSDPEARRFALMLFLAFLPVVLPIAVNADSLATWFLPALGRVPAGLRTCFELHREDQDHTTTLLREGVVMAAVTSSPDPVQGCSVTPLGRMRYLPVASPAFVTRWLAGRPLCEVVGTVPVVVFDRRDGMQDAFARRLTGGRDAGPLRHQVPSSEGFADAVTAGMGWGMLPTAQAEPGLAANRLVRLDPERVIDVPLYWQQWKLDSPPLAATAEAVGAAAAESLDPPRHHR